MRRRIEIGPPRPSQGRQRSEEVSNADAGIRWGHASSPDAEAWHGMYETREEAITDGRQDYSGDDYWITSGHLVPLEAVLPDVDDIIDTMACRASDEAGECAEEYPDLTLAAKAELAELLYAWGEKYARPQFWVADGEPEHISLATERGER